MCIDIHISLSCGTLSNAFLKVQIDRMYCFIVVGVICFYDLSKEMEQACQAAMFVLETMLRVTYQVVHFQVFD